MKQSQDVTDSCNQTQTWERKVHVKKEAERSRHHACLLTWHLPFPTHKTSLSARSVARACNIHRPSYRQKPPKILSAGHTRLTLTQWGPAYKPTVSHLLAIDVATHKQRLLSHRHHGKHTSPQQHTQCKVSPRYKTVETERGRCVARERIGAVVGWLTL